MRRSEHAAPLADSLTAEDSLTTRAIAITRQQEEQQVLSSRSTKTQRMCLKTMRKKRTRRRS
jgi:hypothetical protein